MMHFNIFESLCHIGFYNKLYISVYGNIPFKKTTLAKKFVSLQEISCWWVRLAHKWTQKLIDCVLLVSAEQQLQIPLCVFKRLNSINTT